MEASGLRAPDVAFFSMWEGESVVGVGALRQLSPEHGEVKSMYVDETRRRTGAGRAMLAHIISTARSRGMSRISLETGSWEYFRPARKLYQGFGFVECPPFGDYKSDPNSVFMTLDLRAGGRR
jgi:putative acetyltransferase